MFQRLLAPPIVALSTFSLLASGCKAPSGPDPKSGRPVESDNKAEGEQKTATDPSPAVETDRAALLAPGSRLRIWLPKELERLGRVLLYRTLDARLVVAVAELKVPKSEVDAMLGGILKGAADLKVVSEGQRNGAREIVLSGEKSGKEAQMLILEKDGVAATVYVVASSEHRENAKKILASVELDEKAKLEPLKIHGLGVGPLGSMEIGQGTHQPILFTRQGQQKPQGASSAVAFISVQPHNYGGEITKEQLGKLMGAPLSHLEPNFETAKTNQIKIAGRDAQELVLQGKKGDTPLAIYAYALADGDTAIIAIAYVQLDRADQELADVVPLLRSLELGPL